jgi:hypothetical protein
MIRPTYRIGIAVSIRVLIAAAACTQSIAAAQEPAQSSGARGPIDTLAPLDAREPITYFIAEGVAGSAYRAADRELAEWALQAWARSAEGTLRFEPATESAALLRLYWVPASAGQYGEMRPLVVGGRRGAAVFVRPDTDALGAGIAGLARQDALLRDAIVYLTCVHELGHALGLEHSADYSDVMYFFGYGGDVPAFFNRYRKQLSSRRDIANVSGLSAGDLSRLRSLYDID